MKLEQQKETVLNVLENTDSLPLMDGSISQNLKKEVKFVPKFQFLEKLVNGTKKVLTEESFYQIYIVEELSRDDAVKKYRKDGLTIHAWNLSMREHKNKFPEEMKRLKHIRYSKALKGNTHGARLLPATVVSKEHLQELVESGKSFPVIAKELGISEWFVRRNMQLHQIKKDVQLPYLMVSTDIYYLEMLEQFSPGIVEAAKNYYNYTGEFFDLLYRAFLKIMELLWFIQSQKSSHDYYREKKLVPKNHISFNLNKYEILLSQALLEYKIAHIRYVFLGERLSVDFGFPDSPLLVEVDGEYHEQEETKQRDRRKEELAKEQGKYILRFKIKTIENNLPQIIADIQQHLLHPLKV